MTETEIPPTKVTINLGDDAPFGTESPWVSDLEIDPQDETHATAILLNSCFHVRLVMGDKVELRLTNGRWQVMNLLARCPNQWAWGIFLTTEEELRADVMVDEMTYRGRWVDFEVGLLKAVPEVEQYIKIEGALGVAPMVVLAIADAPLEVLVAVDGYLTESEESQPVSIYMYSQPTDLDHPEQIEEIVGEISQEPLPEPPVIETSYKAEDDPFWADTFDPEDLDSLHETINEMAARDQRVATDLENGRHDRVMLLIERLLTDPEDLVPLGHPIWED